VDDFKIDELMEFANWLSEYVRPPRGPALVEMVLHQHLPEPSKPRKPGRGSPAPSPACGAGACLDRTGAWLVCEYAAGPDSGRSSAGAPHGHSSRPHSRRALTGYDRTCQEMTPLQRACATRRE
jgi:hypothetical protein